MRLSVVKYLQWVFPVLFRAHDDHVIYDRQKYTSERDLIVVLYSNFLALPESHYRERGFDKMWALVDSIADEDLLFYELGNEIARIAWAQGFVSRLDKILIVKENAADEYYWCLSIGNGLGLIKFALKYMGKFKDYAVWRKYEIVNPELS